MFSFEIKCNYIMILALYFFSDKFTTKSDWNDYIFDSLEAFLLLFRG